MNDMSWDELPDGFYYIKLDDGKIRTDCYENGYGFIRTSEKDIEKILSPVPSYKEYLESEAHCAVCSEENKQLKDLLKECLPIVSAEVMTWQIRGGEESHQRGKELLTKIEEVLR